MRKTKRRKWLAAIVAGALVAGLLGGCGKAGQESGSMGSEGGGMSSGSAGSEGGSGAGQAGGEPDQLGKGRYVEKQETLPQELQDRSIIQMYTAEGKLRLLATEQENGKTLVSEWEKQGEGFTEVTQGWLAAMDLPAADWIELGIAQGEGGTQYLYAGYQAEDEESFRTRLWKGQGDTALEITPQEWTVPNETTGGYEIVTSLAALDNGSLAALTMMSMQVLSGEDGSILETGDMQAYYEGGIVVHGSDFYLRSPDESGHIEKYTGGKTADAQSIPYPSVQAAEGEVTVGGVGSLALAALQDGTLFAGSADGIFKLSGGAEGQWEQLALGMDTDFSVADCWCMDFAAMEDGTLYALFQTEGEMKLNRYEYDPDAVSEVTEVLKLYTVYEDSLLKQAATLYHKAHPEVLINIESAYPQYYFDTPDYDAVYQKLNTMLMGDQAPDLVVMDHLNMDSYADKGLLADVEDILKPLEDGGELLSNITGAYVREDGKRYVVPLQFGFRIAMGRDIAVEDMRSMEALAGFLAQKQESYLGNRTAAELVAEFYPYFCAEIVSEKQLDREAMGKYLDYLKAIGDNCGIIQNRSENEVTPGMWELSSETKLAFEKAVGFIDCMFPMSMVDYIKGVYTAFDNRFIPSQQIGICSKSQHMDTARDFLRFALSEEVQSMESYSGFPVNRAALQKLAAKDRSMYCAATMIKGDDGSYLEFSSEAYPQETAENLAALCEGLDKPVKEDAKILEVLTECVGGFLDGSQSKEDTIQKIEDGLKMYLAE